MFLLLGGFIFYNTNILNEYVSGAHEEKVQVAYELTYKKFEKIPQPRITGVKLEVELFPAQRKVVSSGSLSLENKSGRDITDVLVRLHEDAAVTGLDFTVRATLVPGESRVEDGLYVFRLAA
ncbi:MAG: hypothetical protein GY757_42825, partial [bacterium]|nr:hypothetical protein [bacterium]